MKGPESILRNGEEAWKSREEAEHRDRFREYDFTAGEPDSATLLIYHPASRIALYHFNVTIVNVLNSRVTRFTYPVLAFDRVHAEWLALSYHRGTPAETYYVENKL